MTLPTKRFDLINMLVIFSGAGMSDGRMKNIHIAGLIDVRNKLTRGGNSTWVTKFKFFIDLRLKHFNKYWVFQWPSILYLKKYFFKYKFQNHIQ